MKNKAPLIAAALLLACSAIAQTQISIPTMPPPPSDVDVSNALVQLGPIQPGVGAFAQFEAILGMHNAQLHYFNNSNEVSLKIGTTSTTLRPGIDVDNDLSFYHRLASGNYYSAGINVDSLGTGGQAIQAVTVTPLRFAFNWDNLRPEIGLGYLRDIENNGHAICAPMGIDIRFSNTGGFFIGITPGYMLSGGGSKSGKAFVGAQISASFAIGK